MRRAIWLVALFVPAFVTGVAAMKRAAVREAVTLHEARVAPVPCRADAMADEAGRESRRTTGGEDGSQSAVLRSRSIGGADSAEGAPELAAYSRTSGRRVAFGALDWKAGAEWTVESHYRQMQGRGDWSDVIVWRYSVRGVEKIGGVEAFVVEVRPETEMPYNAGGTMYVGVEDHSVVGVRDRVLERGQVRERFVRFDDGAVSVLFPTELPRRDAEARERSGAVPPPASPFGSAPKANAPAAAAVVDVSFDSNGTTIRQRWDAANRAWPLVSSTPSRVSYLK